LDHTSITLIAGSSQALKATVLPANATYTEIIWTSSNEGVAKVDKSGVVTAVDAGEATISAKAGDKTATCAVTVTVPVESISLDHTSITLIAGSSQALKATVLPANATYTEIIWTSSNEGVAKVDKSGVVTAVDAGEATISAKAGDKTATCAVTVTVPVESISMDQTSITLIAGESQTLKATVLPSNATYTEITWTSDNNGVATVKDGVVSAVGKGTTNIRASIGNVSASCSVSVLVDSADGVYAQYYGGSMSIINGLIQYGSKLNFGVVNYSSETITVVSAQLIDGVNGSEGNVMNIGVEIEPTKSSAWSITIGLYGIHSPTCRFVYKFKGVEYTCEAQYKDWSW